jgi:predicted ABC-type transport system involved in lysophospholipase L1 biosynthesis ATPase subunit
MSLPLPDSTTPLLRARDLCQSFPLADGRRLEVLKGISLDVVAGEAVFLVGASGAGKSTLLYTIAGLEKPTGGTIEFEGQSLHALSRGAQARVRNRRMGFVFQSYCLLPELTALENVRLPLMLAGVGTPDERDARAVALLTEVGLAERLHHAPLELSGGEQQRVAIARALANDPAILFADEPTGNLDSKAGGAVMDLLLALVREKRKTLVVVTHDLRLAGRGDRRLEMRDGTLLTSEFASNNPEEPRNPSNPDA